MGTPGVYYWLENDKFKVTPPEYFYKPVQVENLNAFLHADIGEQKNSCLNLMQGHWHLAWKDLISVQGQTTRVYYRAGQLEKLSH